MNFNWKSFLKTIYYFWHFCQFNWAKERETVLVAAHRPLFRSNAQQRLFFFHFISFFAFCFNLLSKQAIHCETEKNANYFCFIRQNEKKSVCVQIFLFKATNWADGRFCCNCKFTVRFVARMSVYQKIFSKKITRVLN